MMSEVRMLKTVSNPHGELERGSVVRLPRADAEGLVAVGKAVWHVVESVRDAVRAARKLRRKGGG
jgi:hypothetical protein